MKNSKKGFTLVEIMIVVAIIALIAAIAISNVLRGRTTSNEAAAVGNMRALVSSLHMFHSVNAQFPASFCVAMSASTVSGNNYTYTGAAAPAETYTILAVPTTLGTTGTRSFFADQSGEIVHCTGTATLAHFTDNDEAGISAIPTACD